MLKSWFRASRGLKPGLLSGLVFGLTSAAIPLTFAAFRNSGVSPVQLFVFFVVGDLLIGIAGGLIFGPVYAILFDAIPGRTPILKGLVFSLFLWALFLLILARGQNPVDGVVSGLVNGLAPAIVSGYVLGRIYHRASNPTVSKPSEAAPDSSPSGTADDRSDPPARALRA